MTVAVRGGTRLHAGAIRSAAGLSSGDRPVDWRDEAVCRDLPAGEVDRLFFPADAEETLAVLPEARRFCAPCPVRGACAAATRNDTGLFAGMTPLARRRAAAPDRAASYRTGRRSA